MSTFRGVVEEFLDIRIDYFRRIPGRDNPLACFLSHVHSDHLQGLESFRSTFIYCSPTTRELLLRLEKKSHRIHFRQGLLESRKQTYKHLTRLLKTIPLNAPTEIELKPGISLRVTLLDANHCAGAVMFLIENDTKAILYTGDIRSEPWWVNSLIRNPVILPYAHGIRRLDKIYLDTTFASKSIAHRRFPTKEDGLKELLEKVCKYPIDTCFHLHAWTFGYEDVWIALSSALKSQCHLDEYNYSLYESLGTTAKDKNLCSEGPALYGFECANKFQNGCLTPKENVRLHSCQRELGCSALAAPDVVYIRPILWRSREGNVLHELGAGGGGGDLNRVHKLELNDAAAVRDLIEMCKTGILDENTRSSIIDLIIKAKRFGTMDVPLDILDVGWKDETTPILLTELPELLAKLVAGGGKLDRIDETVITSSESAQSVDRSSKSPLGTCPVNQELPRIIEFPYSRHSSYEELCNLVKAFKPVDVYPCTIHEGYEDLSVSIECLFGHLCVGSTFSHDEEMKLLASQRETLKRCANDRDSQTMTSSREQNVQERDTSPVSALECASDPESRPLDNLERVPKRPRISPSKLRNQQDDLNTRRLATGLSSPKRKLSEYKQSFSNYVKRSKSEKISAVLKSANRPFSHAGGDEGTSRTAILRNQVSSAAPPVEHDPNGSLFPNEHSSNHGTQAEPIELSDDDTSNQDDKAGDFLLEEMPEPDYIPNALNESQSDSETQVTLSDVDFESQASHVSNLDLTAIRLRRRKEAYKAAKEPASTWGIDHGLLSSNACHWEEEIEL